MVIKVAEIENLEQILEIQYLAFQNEAEEYNDFQIEPLQQTVEDLEKEFQTFTYLKAIDENDRIIGSTRGYVKDGTSYIGKTFVHPNHQGKGVGSQLIMELESINTAPRYEINSSIRCPQNIKLYEKLGYVRFKETRTENNGFVFLQKQTKETPIMNKFKNYIYNIVIVCLLGIMAFCGYQIYNYFAKEAEQTKAFEDIAKVVEQARENEEDAPKIPYSETENVLAEYGELFLQNADTVGWIKIAGTKINYPVMQTPNNPNYYLKHNFQKAYSDMGTPYVQEDCNVVESDNLIIYGHHMKSGKMFGALENYKSQSFYEEHKIIQFDTLTQRGEYEIVAVFKTVAYNGSGFRYNDFVHAENEEAFTDYVEKCKELSLFDTGLNAEYGEKLITLSTCEYSAQNGRLVVVAKKFG